MVDSDAGRALEARREVLDPDAEAAAGAAVSAAAVLSDVTAVPLALSAVKRSVSVTDFLSFPRSLRRARVPQSQHALSRTAERGAHTVAAATAVARIRRHAANRQSTSRTQEDWVVVLVSTQADTLRLLDESENNSIRSSNQATSPLGV
ncbi:hypothetical protein M2272_004094 [Mycobacterium frederiksbergense]|uniref:Uncharacterized protein n=1 Tax=Mycolicibacterium frederiksbergense TaxID=117567 RepID=A0ABT6L3C8_9MYCO|nr:hypothetical protein [Mycolicibacterium frederiksbergense]MDH6197439.1 hypothetical protein [Mycolicibacterium frederiksbergense]